MFSAKILAYMPYLMIKVLTINDIVSFEPLGPEVLLDGFYQPFVQDNHYKYLVSHPNSDALN